MHIKIREPPLLETYQIILIGHSLSKIYGAMLEKTLNIDGKVEEIQAPCQVVFWRSFSIIDIIILCFSMNQEKAETKMKRRDFHKAFDIVPSSLKTSSIEIVLCHGVGDIFYMTKCWDKLGV